MKYNIKRNGVDIASVEEKTYTDTWLTAETDYTYTVEIEGVEGSEASVTTKTTLPKTNIFVSNREVGWYYLPAYNPQGDVILLSQEVRDNVPVRVETGKIVERFSPRTNKIEQVPETRIEYQTRTLYTYEADFEWANDHKGFDWLIDVLQFKNNQLFSGYMASYEMSAEKLTAAPNLDTSNVTDMTFMFMDAENFDQDISMWCVEQIPDKPYGFDGWAGFQGQDHKQPKWGQPC